MNVKREAMVRVEIIANKSVQEDLIDVLEAAVPGIYYTIFPEVRGKGRQGTRKGDDIWPELNCMVLVFCGKETAERIEKAVCHVKDAFPREGIKLFLSEEEG